ncbi:LysM peptidoglycan-binding domain-containing protein [Kitasatospora sp. MBT63]|uniref:LysM peptidoglycan-binding domain-containing protein n=1 Tax=Kitasatospora sp. MBT63 TaxID=1444768 RepID=UPI00053B7EF9|nr:LysM peptidoglycan-binding domain-containing protein [Kitasatospora sp. MBT63]
MPRRTTSRIGAALRALLSLTVLATLLVAVPLLLWRVGVLPGSVPGLGDITDALTSPDNGTLFLGAVTLLGWAGWLQFAFAVLVELFYTVVRRRSAPRIRVLGAPQRLAGVLVASIVLLVPTGAAMASPATASAVTASASATPGAVQAAPAATAAASNASWTGPVHEVHQGDTMWGIAEAKLGDGVRWKEIADLNIGVTQPDGTVMTADTTWLQPGWTLRLPGDATAAPATAAPAPAAAATAGHSHTVKAGETLSSIAEHELGDADRYPEIVELNKDHPQPDGAALTDPDTIRPGWDLTLPATAEAPAPQAPAIPQTPAPATPAPAPESATPAAPAPGPSLPAPGAEAPAPATQAPAAQPSAPAAESQSTEADTGTNSTGTEADDSQLTVVGAGAAFLAAGLLTALGVRRTLQQRRRRHRRRIPMPKGEAAAVEREMRSSQAVIGPEHLDRALRTLAVRCAEAGRPLPEIEAVHLSPQGIDLYLAAPTAPVKPFQASDTVPDAWTCPARSAQLLTQEDAAVAASPYPALVSLGSTLEEDSTVLVNLECVGLLSLTGAEDDVRDVQLALAAELCTSQLTRESTVVLAGVGAELAERFPGRAAHYDTTEAAVAELRAHDALQRTALEDADAAGLGEVRLDGAGADAWSAAVLLTADLGDHETSEQITDLLMSRPRTAVAIVSPTDAVSVPSAWRLDAAPGALVTLPGIGLDVVLQRLAPDRYAALIQLLATADREDDIAPPAWTLGASGSEDDPGFLETVLDADEAEHGHEDMPGAPEAAQEDAVQVGAETGVFEEPDNEAQPWQVSSPAALSPSSVPDFTAMLAATRTEMAQEGAEEEAEGAVEDAQEATAPTRLSSISDVLVVLNSDPEPPEHPQVQLLGSVDLAGAQGPVESKRRRTLLEIAAWFVLHPGRRYEEMDAALWPGRRVTPQFRNPLVSKLRQWVGRDPALAADDPAAQYLPAASKQAYQFHPAVTSDWALFQGLYARGMNATGPEADLDLARALVLVRGRPFADINPSRYQWVDADLQEMISAITDVAHELAQRMIAARDFRAAGLAAGKGLTGVPDSEQLHRDLFMVCHALGDREGLRRAAHQLARINDELETDPEDETVELLSQIMESHRESA